MTGIKFRIQEIQPEQADDIIETRLPLGLFYVKLSNVYLGIDNSHGDAWTEAFSSLGQCKRWLRNPNIHIGDDDLNIHFNQNSLLSDVRAAAETGTVIGRCTAGFIGGITGRLAGAAVGCLHWAVIQPFEKWKKQSISDENE